MSQGKASVGECARGPVLEESRTKGTQSRAVKQHMLHCFTTVIALRRHSPPESA